MSINRIPSQTTVTRKGLAPQLSGIATEYLDGTGVFSTPSTGGIDHVVMSDGTIPVPLPVDDGAGNFIYIPYIP